MKTRTDFRESKRQARRSKQINFSSKISKYLVMLLRDFGGIEFKIRQISYLFST